MCIWNAKRDGVFFLLSDESPTTGDYFVFLKPDDRNVVLFNTETLKYSSISTAKLLFYHDKNKRTLTNLVDNFIVNKVVEFDILYGHN